LEFNITDYLRIILVLLSVSEMIEEDMAKRVFISLWHRDNIRQ